MAGRCTGDKTGDIVRDLKRSGQLESSSATRQIVGKNDTAYPRAQCKVDTPLQPSVWWNCAMDGRTQLPIHRL